MITLQYGVVPKGHDYFQTLEVDANLERMLEDSAPILDDHVTLTQVPITSQL